LYSNFTVVNISRYTKPKTFSDCVGQELPYGWEQAVDSQIGIYFIDHTNRESVKIKYDKNDL